MDFCGKHDFTIRYVEKCRITRIALLTLLLSVCVIGQESASTTSDQVNDCGVVESNPRSKVATVDGVVFTFEELDRVIAVQLRDLEERKYQLRRAALEHRINQLLLEKAARTRGIAINSLLHSNLSPVSESEVDAVYQQKKDTLPQGTEYAVKEQIRDALEKQAKQTAYRDTIRELRAQADVTVSLKRPAIAQDLFRSLSGPSLGSSSAPLKLVVFSDYQCGFCRKSQRVIDSLLLKYREKLQIVFKNLAPPGSNPSLLLAKAALCAERQQAFGKYHPLLFEEGKEVSTQRLSELAVAIGLDSEAFDACVQSEDIQEAINRDRGDAAEVGARATPFFLLNGYIIRGAQPIDEFEQTIQQLLKDISCE